MHKGELKPKTLREIIQDLKITVEEFASLLGLVPLRLLLGPR
jgi:hypothetical protein